MAGPVADVLLRRAMTAAEAFDLVAGACSDLGLVAERLDPLDDEALTSVRSPEGEAVAALLAPLDHGWEPAEIDLLERVTGYRPTALLRTDGLTRASGAAVLQGRLLAALAERADHALASLDDVLTGADARGPEVPRQARLAAARAFVAGRRGVVIEVPSDSWDGGQSAFHVVDAEFLRGWLQDPAFYLPN